MMQERGERAGPEGSKPVLLELDAGAYDAPGSSEELASVLTDDLRAISNDKHLAVAFVGSGTAAAPMARSVANGGITSVEKLDGNIGYMEILGMVRLEDARGAIDAAFAELHDTSAHPRQP